MHDVKELTPRWCVPQNCHGGSPDARRGVSGSIQNTLHDDNARMELLVASKDQMHCNKLHNPWTMSYRSNLSLHQYRKGRFRHPNADVCQVTYWMRCEVLINDTNERPSARLAKCSLCEVLCTHRTPSLKLDARVRVDHLRLKITTELTQGKIVRGFEVFNNGMNRYEVGMIRMHLFTKSRSSVGVRKRALSKAPWLNA